MITPQGDVPLTRLIVNADDFGQTPGINEGVIRCHEQGIVTSASLMVRWSAAAEAASYARSRSALSVGLHIDLGEWVWQDGEWVASYLVVDLNDSSAVVAEIGRQLDRFRALMGADPTHLDSHQHVHRSGPVRRAAIDLGARLGIPLRKASERVTYVSFYGQARQGQAISDALTVDRFIGLATALPPGTTELGCHPGLRGDAVGMYVAEREKEVEILCDPRVRASLESHGIRLISFHHLASPPPVTSGL